MAAPVPQPPDDDWVYPTNNNYQPYMVVESYFLPKNNRKTSPFTRAMMLEIGGNDIHRWMCDKAFGDPAITEDGCPYFARASSPDQANNALSYFHPFKGSSLITASGGNQRIDRSCEAP